ncbi:MAG: NUDIX domain-containing protein [Acidobacteria bacterium]|nr:NUDIX domain-containing protein [Acidobacteriota bacterium]
MPREISAGGMVVRPGPAGWELAVIEPQREQSGNADSGKKDGKTVLALPKGLLDPGETPEQTAVREVREETGITARVLTKLKDIQYVYVRSWGDRQRVFKIVTFYLLRYESGTIDELAPSMRIEVKRALWIPLGEARRRLTYRGEREIIGLAEDYLAAHSTEAR